MFYQHTEDAHTVAYMAQSQGLHDRCLSRLHGAVTSRKGVIEEGEKDIETMQDSTIFEKAFQHVCQASRI